MARTRATWRHRATAVGGAALALLLVAGPAGAQTEPYPPVDPEDPEPSIECDIVGHDEGATATCSGQGLDPDEELTTEVTVDDGTSIGRSTEEVDDDGTARAVVHLRCEDLDGDTLTVTGTSVAPDGEQVVATDTEDLAQVCRAALGSGDERDDDGSDVGAGGDEAGERSGSGPGGLAFTGQDIGLLVLIGLLLALAGYGLTRERPRRTT